MNPIRNLAPLASWLLKFSLAIIVYQNYFNTFVSFSFHGLFYFISLLFIVFAVLILLSDILVKQHVTVISGLGIFILSISMMFYHGFSLNHVLSHFIPATLGIYFLSHGK